MKNNYNYVLKVFSKGKMIQRTSTHSIRRFSNKLRLINWQESTPKVYLRISYENGFYNDGTYKTAEELTEALEAFKE